MGTGVAIIGILIALFGFINALAPPLDTRITVTIY